MKYYITIICVIGLFCGCVKDPNEKVTPENIGKFYFNGDSTDAGQSISADIDLRIAVRFRINEETENGKKVKFSVSNGKLLNTGNIASGTATTEVEVTVVNNEANAYYIPGAAAEQNCMIIATVSGVEFPKPFTLTACYPETVYLHTTKSNFDLTEDATVEIWLTKTGSTVSEDLLVEMDPPTGFDKPFYKTVNDNGTIKATAVYKNSSTSAISVTFIAKIKKDDGTFITSAAKTISFQ